MAKFSYQNIKISAIASVVPSNVVTIDRYKERFGENEVEKFKQMTGILETRRALPHQTASDLAVAAAKRVISHKNIDTQEIKALVFGTHSPDYRRPASAFVIAKQLGLSTEAAVFDISLGCSSAVYGLQTVASMMANSDIDKAILVVGDTASKTTNENDRASQMLVGEGAAAILLEKDYSASEMNILLKSNGEGFRYLIVPGGGYRNLHASDEEVICKDGNPRSLLNSFMQGSSVFTFTISDVPKSIKEYFIWTKSGVADYDVFAFHQANGLILKKIAKKVSIPEDKMPITLPVFGNTSGASPLITLCHTYGNHNEGSLRALLVAFGVGISWGVANLSIDIKDILPITEDDSIFEEGLITSVTDL